MRGLWLVSGVALVLSTASAQSLDAGEPRVPDELYAAAFRRAVEAPGLAVYCLGIQDTTKGKAKDPSPNIVAAVTKGLTGVAQVKPLSACKGGASKGSTFVTAQEVDLGGLSASVEVEERDGSRCGNVSTYRLRVDGQHWVVTDVLTHTWF